jgi:uncharacterized SAM-binding protein YcdF (DUF218 family)
MLETLFLIKKIISACLMPMSFGFLLLALAAIFYSRRYFKTAKTLTASVVMLWYLISLPPVANLLANPLENQLPKYANQQVSHVLVLGGYHSSDQRKPISSLLSPISLMRLTEGIHIYHLNPGSKLLLSGYKSRDIISNAEAMANVARSLGVPSEDIILATEVKDTSEEAEHWVHFLTNEKAVSTLNHQALALVTSASHMPRAVLLFNQHIAASNNLQLVPAPTAYKASSNSELHWSSFFPSANAMQVSEAAWHEYLGLAWAYLTQ